MKKTNPHPAPSYLLAGLVGGGIGFAVLFALCALLALLLPRAGTLSAVLMPGAIGVSAASGFVAGMLGGIKMRCRNPFLGALSAGAVLLLLFVLASLIVPGQESAGFSRVLPALLALLASILAGMTVSSHRNRPRKRV